MYILRTLDVFVFFYLLLSWYLNTYTFIRWYFFNFSSCFSLSNK